MYDFRRSWFPRILDRKVTDLFCKPMHSECIIEGHSHGKQIMNRHIFYFIQCVTKKQVKNYKMELPSTSFSSSTL